MSNEGLKHIFDSTTCLSKRQMKDYVSGVMTNEEAHAVELHLNSCPLCNDAIDGLFEQQEGALTEVTALNTDFLKDHFGNINPQVHLNSITATHHARHIDLQKKKEKVHHIWRTVSIAAGLLLLVGVIWMYRFTHQPELQPQTAAITPMQQPPALAQQLKVTEQVNSFSLNTPSIKPEEKGAIAMADEKKPSADVAQAVPAMTTAENPKRMDEVVVKSYKAPLISDREVRTADEIEKLPTRSTNDVAAVSPGVNDRRFGNSYTPAEAPATKEGKTITSDEIEKLPTRNTNSVAPTTAGVYQSKDKNDVNIGGARSEGTTYIVDGVRVYGSRGTNLSQSNVETSGISKKYRDAIKEPDADELYKSKNYKAALEKYTAVIRSDANRRHRHEAAIGAAKCYIALGNKAKAKEILQSIINEGGPGKRDAKKLLELVG